jgi:hypothetical protein
MKRTKKLLLFVGSVIGSFINSCAALIALG